MVLLPGILAVGKGGELRVLITGGAGFIGSHVCDALLATGATVYCVDNYLTGRPQNIQHLSSHPRFHFTDVDVSQSIPDVDVDRIYHLASPASPVGYQRYPIETLRVNSLGTFNCLELAYRKSARFLLVSTSEIYGDPLEHPQEETYWGNVNPIGPRSMYDEGKRFAEAATVSYVDTRGIDGRIVRIFNTYGPRNDPQDGRLMPTLITQALTGQPLAVFGSGRQTRSFCYVDDLVRGLIAAMEVDDAKREVFNLGNPDERPIIEYAEIIQRLSGTDSSVIHVEDRPEEIQRRCPDISKARQRLAWSPQVAIEDGLRVTISWFREEVCKH